MLNMKSMIKGNQRHVTTVVHLCHQPPNHHIVENSKGVRFLVYYPQKMVFQVYDYYSSSIWGREVDFSIVDAGLAQDVFSDPHPSTLYDSKGYFMSTEVRFEGDYTIMTGNYFPKNQDDIVVGDLPLAKVYDTIGNIYWTGVEVE